MINDLGKMKFYIFSIGLRMRSLDLSLKGYQTALTINQYITSISSASTNLTNLLYGLDKYSSFIPIKDDITNTEYIIWKFSNGIPIAFNDNLFNGILQMVSVSDSLLNTNLNSTDSLLMIYRNAFSSLFTSLNNTSYNALKKIFNQSGLLFTDANWIKIFLFLPILLLSILSIPIFISLEIINKELWKSISNISNHTFLLIKNKTIERLNKLHDLDLKISDSETNRAGKLYSSIWKKYFFSFIILTGMVLGYFLIENYILETSLNYLNHLQVDRRFWEDYQRSLSYSSFIWAREAKLAEFTNISYQTIITEHMDIPSVIQEYQQSIKDFISIIDETKRKTISAISKGYDYSIYINMLNHDPCYYFTTVNVTNCKESMVKYGISIASQTYKLDLDDMISSNLTINWNDLARFENLSYTFGDALFESSNYYQENTENHINDIFNALIGLCIIMIFIIILYCIFIIRPQILKIQKELLSRNQINIMFKDSKLNRTPSMQSETGLSIDI